jgi:hypothetical protein
MDQVTGAERRAIEDFLAKKGVTKVPPGTSGFQQWQWSDEAGRLMPIGDGQSFGRRPGARARATRGRILTISSEISARRRHLAEIFSPDADARELARHLGCSAQTVRNDVKALGLSFSARESAVRTVAARRKDLAAMAQETGGRVTREVSQAIRDKYGCSGAAVASDAKILGLVRAGKNGPAPGSRREISKGDLAALYADPRLGWDAIAKSLGVSVCSAQNAVRKLGLAHPQGRMGVRRDGLMAEGFEAAYRDPALSWGDLAERFGYAVETLAKTAKAEGWPRRSDLHSGAAS